MMRVKNLTSSLLKLKVEEMTPEHREYIVYIEPDSSTDLERLKLLDKESLYGKVEIDGVKLGATVDTSDESSDQVDDEEVSEDKEDESSDQEYTTTDSDNPTEEIDNKVDTYVCDQCGAEFASARGLSSHMNRVHSK